MKISKIYALFVAVIVLLSCIAFKFSAKTPAGNMQFEKVADNPQGLQENEPFDIMMSALTHKRCVNCYPAADRPLQG